MSYRSYSSHIKSLLHFNYPYYAETGDGLTDDIGGFTWSRSGSAKLAGSESPADLIISGTPKFGYRCLHTENNSDCITGTRSAAMSLSQLEVSLWLRVSASGTGNILQLKNGSAVVLLLTVGADLKLTASSSSLGFSLASSETLSLNAWHHIRLQVSSSAVRLSVNNSAGSSAAANGSALPAFSAITLGGLHGEIDEFVLRDSFTDSLPSEPEKAACNVNALGGFGDGRLGNVTISSTKTINTSAKAVLSSGKSNLALSGKTTGMFGDFAMGDEVMLLDMESGAYEFRTVSGVSGNTLQVSKAFTISGNTLQAIQMLNFQTLTVSVGPTHPRAWDGYSGGVIAFRVKGNCTINGQIITSGYGRPRTDSYLLTHSGLIDRFITSTGGGIFITCGGTFTAGSSARLGASWSGAGKAGAPAKNSKGGYGGAGYGGAGGSDTDSGHLGGNGGVGGGGGGSDGAPSVTTVYGYDAGKPSSTTGGSFFAHDDSNSGTTRIGGTQGRTSGGKGIRGGGGGAGGNGSNIDSKITASGASLILIAKTLKADAAAISTGGAGGLQENNSYQYGGGGTGFCYIACERMS